MEDWLPSIRTLIAAGLALLLIMLRLEASRFSAVIVDTASRSHTISLRRYRNAAEIRAAFSAWDAARALPDAS